MIKVALLVIMVVWAPKIEAQTTAPFSLLLSSPTPPDSCISIGDSFIFLDQLRNSGTITLTLDSIYIRDTIHYELLGPFPPIILKSGTHQNFQIRYKPDHIGIDSTIIHLHFKDSNIVIESILKECGTARNLVQIFTDNKSFAYSAPIPNPCLKSNVIRFVFELSKASRLRLDVIDMKGNIVATPIPESNYDIGLHENFFPTISLAPSTYLYRYRVSEETYSGLLIIK